MPTIDPFDAKEIAEAAACFRFVYDIPGCYINDHCLIRDEGSVFHLFFILGEVGGGCATVGNEVIIGHATSADLLEWKSEAHALEQPEDCPYWESGHIFAPYVIRHEGLYYMFYTGDTPGFGQRMGLATSTDLFGWERHPDNPLITPIGDWAYWEEEKPASCRDPHVHRLPDGTFLMYWVGDIREDPNVNVMCTTSCLALSRSTDLVHWEEVGPILVRRWSELESLTCKTESPCMIERHGRFFLFYRHGNGTKYSISDVPTDWRGRDTYFLGPCHASEVFEVDGQWYVTSCSRPMTDLAHKQDRSTGLFLARMDWDDMLPRIVPL